MEKGEASLQVFRNVEILSALEFSTLLPVTSGTQMELQCLAVRDILLYKNRGKGLQTEFSLLSLKEREENEGRDSKMDYSTPYEDKIARKSSDVHMQDHLEVLDI